jgi:hypothetical protein
MFVRKSQAKINLPPEVSRSNLTYAKRIIIRWSERNIMFRKAMLAVLIVVFILALQIAPAFAGDPSQWGVDGDPSQWGLHGDPTQWLHGDPSQWVYGDPSQWLYGDPTQW